MKKMVLDKVRLLQCMKLSELFSVLMSWTNVIDAYHDEELNVGGRRTHLSVFIVIAVVSWIFIVFWFILNITKVYSFLDISPLTNTVLHVTIASFMMVASLLIANDQPMKQLFPAKPGAVFGLVSSALLIIDTILFLILKQRTEDDQ